MHLGCGYAVAFAGQRPRQVHLRAVDSEDRVPFPELACAGQAGPFEDPGMKGLEHRLVQLGPGLAHRRSGDRRRLGQVHSHHPTLIPKLAQRDRIEVVPKIRTGL